MVNSLPAVWSTPFISFHSSQHAGVLMNRASVQSVTATAPSTAARTNSSVTSMATTITTLHTSHNLLPPLGGRFCPCTASSWYGVTVKKLRARGERGGRQQQSGRWYGGSVGGAGWGGGGRLDGFAMQVQEGEPARGVSEGGGRSVG